jgi:DNA-binding transcriptional regulator YdaS (Cro superfamily)
MTLKEFFRGKPRGSKAEMCLRLGITRTWMSQIVSGRRVPSPELCVSIESVTLGQVTRADLRPDLFR